LPDEHLFLRNGSPIVLSYRALCVLVTLVERDGHLVEKTELMNTVWRDCSVEEGNLAVTISALRKALGDTRNEHRYIQTVTGYGYRFAGHARKASHAPVEATDLIQIPSDTTEATDQLPKHSAAPAITVVSVSARWRRFLPVSLSVASALILGSLFIWLFSGTHGFTWAHSSIAASPGIRTLAVLPFENVGTDPEYSELGGGIVDDLTDRLGKEEFVAVRPSTVAMKYTNGHADPIAAGRKEEVDGVLTGTILGLNGKIRISAQLFRVKDGSLVWHATFTEPLSRAFDLEEELEESLAQTLLPAKPGVHPATTETPDSEAYRLYLEGRYFWHKRTGDGIRRSIDDFQRATQMDPNFALAYAGLADSYSTLAVREFGPRDQSFLSAQVAALRALRLDDTLAEAHASLGQYSLFYEWDWSKADHEFRRAIDLNPNYSEAHLWYSSGLAAAGRLPEALKEAQRGQELDPVSAVASVQVGRVYYWSREFDQAIAAYRHAIDLDPLFSLAYQRLGMTYLAQKRYSDAVREFRLEKKLFPQDMGPDGLGLLGYAEAKSGNTVAARRILEDLIQRSAHEYIPSSATALIYIGLGKNIEALDCLSKSYQDKPKILIFASIDPLFDPLRLDPRFSSLLTQIGPGLPKTETQTAAYRWAAPLHSITEQRGSAQELATGTE
jgi:DNA-binding winged helix-turn-helix (wHTH) protein/TolB-like protein/uncharacterized protein HemY